MSEPAAQYFSKTKAAAELDKSTATLDRWVRDGRIPAYQRGREIVFLPEDVERIKQESLRLKPIEQAV